MYKLNHSKIYLLNKNLLEQIPELLTMCMNLVDFEEFQETDSACLPQNL